MIKTFVWCTVVEHQVESEVITMYI